MTGGNSREIILKVAFSLLIFSSLGQGVIAQCMTPVKNIAVYERTQNTLINILASPIGVKWTVLATTDELTMVTLVNYNDTINSNYTADYAFESSGLTIKTATTTAEPGHRLSTAGLYTVEYFGWDADYSFKFLVVRQGPTCSCTMVNSSTIMIQVTCSSIYADITYDPIAAIFTLYVNGNPVASDAPDRAVNDRYTWISTSKFTTAYSGSSTYECGLTFGQPTEILHPKVAMNAPTLDQKCSVPGIACVGTIATTKSSTSSPSSTTATTASTTGADEQCFTSITTTVVYEGTLDTMLNFAAGPNGTSWMVLPTSNLEISYRITDFSDVVSPTLTGLYAINRMGLIVRNATTTNATGGPIPTAGISTVQLANTNNLMAFKLVVIRSGPICSCSQLASGSVSISCTIIYADHPASPINAIMKCKANDGQFYTSITPTKTLLPYTPIQYVYNSTSTITVSNTVPAVYDCLVTFAAPPYINPRSLAPNAPDFNAASTVYCSSTVTTQSTTMLEIKRKIQNNSTFEVVAVTPRTTEESIGQPLPIIIEFSPTPFNMTFNKEFIYLPNPEIKVIYPNHFIVDGGTRLDVHGQSLSSVAKPIIQLTVVITRSAENSSASTTSTMSTSRVCTVPIGNGTYMECPMPPLNLPNDFLENLNSVYNTSTIRTRRSRNLINQLNTNSHSVLSRLKRDTNVLTVRGANGVDRADIYLGFILDGYNEYENINDALPDTKFIFYLAPEINKSNEVIEFDPTEDELIYVKGGHMSRGCRIEDYLVHIGNQICINDNLTDNELSCRPPKEKPSSTGNDSWHCGQHLSITISLGYKQYQYACLTYPDNSKTFALIVGLTVGLAGFALFLTILIVCILSCRKKKESQEIDRHQDTGGHELRNPHYNDDVEPEPPQDYIIAHEREYDSSII